MYHMGCDNTLIILLPRNRFIKNGKKTKPIDAYSKYVGRTLYCEDYIDGMPTSHEFRIKRYYFR